MRRISLAMALIGAAAAAGCAGKPAPSVGSDVQQGVQGSYYFVNLFTPPLGGYITSDVGGINCGATSVSVNNAVTPPQYVYQLGTHAACGVAGQTQVAWSQTITLTATPETGKAFLGWAGDCTGYDPCVLSAGADKGVIAIFGTPGSGHPNFMDPAVHSAAITMLDCSQCHGASLQGQGIAPSCSATGCHTTTPGGSTPMFTDRTGMGTNLVAAITSVTPSATQGASTITFTLKDGAGADVYVTGQTGQNLPMPVTTAIMNFGTDAGGNALPYKNQIGGNPGTVTAFAAITPSSGQPANTLTSGTLPASYTFTYPDGTLTQAAPAKSCTQADKCVCSAGNPCVYSGTVGYGFRTVSGVKSYGACSVASPCACTTANPCAPALPTTNGPGMLTFAAGVYTYTFAPVTATANLTTGYALSGTQGVTTCTEAAPCACTVADPCVCSAAVPCLLPSPFPQVGSPLLANTHTAWLATYRREDMSDLGYLGLGKYTAQNVQFNFDASTGAAVAAKRDIVSDASCAKCHDGFKVETNTSGAATAEFHSGARISGPYCNVCHYEGRGTNGFADSATFAHRIHNGKELTHVSTGSVTTGYQKKWMAPVQSCSASVPCVCTVLEPCSQYTFHGIEVTYPQDPRNCTECHDASSASKAGQYLTRPTIAACGSCHDQLKSTFLPIAGLQLDAHPASDPAIRTNADCAGCHTPANISSHHEPVQAPASDSCYTLNNVTGCNTNTNAGYIAAVGFVPPGADAITYEIQSVGTWLDGANRRPQMVFRMLRNGTPVDLGTYAAGTKDELLTGYVGGPSLYWVWAVPQDGITAPADFNASTSNWLKQCWRSGTNCTLTLTDAVNGWYTIQNRAAVVSTSAVMLTGGIGYSYNMNSAQPLTQTNLPAFPVTPTDVTAGTIAFGDATAQTCSVATPCVATVGGLVVAAENVWKVAAGHTSRRVVVDNDKCNACHGQLGVEPTFHAGQRNDAPSCSWCHTPNRTSSGWSANASSFVHAIHSAVKRDVDYNWHAACQFGATWNATTQLCERAGVAEVPSIWYPHIEYPGTVGNCTQCHVAGGFDFSLPASAAALDNLLWSTVGTGTGYSAGMSTSPYVALGTAYGSGPSFSASTGNLTAAAATTLVISPIAAACFGCHTSTAAQDHMEVAGRIYGARGAGFNAAASQETCLNCHGTGGIVPINKVHRLP